MRVFTPQFSCFNSKRYTRLNEKVLAGKRP